MTGICDFMSFTILGRASDYLGSNEHFRTLVLLWADLVSASFLTQSKLTDKQTPPCARAYLHMHVCILENARMHAPNTFSTSPPTFLSPLSEILSHITPCSDLLIFLTCVLVFTSSTVHQVTRQSLVKCDDLETVSLRDAMSISSTKIFHRKIKGAGVTAFPCGHK